MTTSFYLGTCLGRLPFDPWPQRHSWQARKGLDKGKAYVILSWLVPGHSDSDWMHASGGLKTLTTLCLDFLTLLLSTCLELLSLSVSPSLLPPPPLSPFLFVFQWVAGPLTQCLSPRSGVKLANFGGVIELFFSVFNSQYIYCFIRFTKSNLFLHSCGIHLLNHLKELATIHYSHHIQL